MKNLVIPKTHEITAYQQAMAEVLQRSKADNTADTYQTAIRVYQSQGGVFPATALSIAAWLEVAQTTDGKLFKVSSLQTYLAAIAAAHISLGLENPCADPLVLHTLKALKKERGTQQKQARALLLEELSQMCDSSSDNELSDVRDKALLLVGWVCALRRSELVNVRFEHLRLMPQGYELSIPHSKTDQAGQGWQLPIPYAKKFRYCPVEALRAWIAALNEQGFTTGYIFRGVNKSQRIKEAGLTPHSVDYLVKKRAELARLKPVYTLAGKKVLAVSAHSLRAGFITAGALAKLPDWMLQATSRHSSTEMLHRYIRAARLFEDSAAVKML